MKQRRAVIFFLIILLVTTLACQAVTGATETPTVGVPTATETMTPTITPTPTPLPPRPVEPGEDNPDEPVYITGEIPFTSPFFLNTISEAFVLLEDQGGFIARDLEFEFLLAGQVLGPVELVNEDTVTFGLALPAIPQGTQTDLDNDDEEDAGVQVFAVAYWSNTWGGPFLERRDGTGWSTAYASTTTDADRDHEIDGGTLIVWAPNDQQGFPTGYGPDAMLFTADDPTAPIPAGYTLVDLDSEPFTFYKETRPSLTLHEGDLSVNDFSELGYGESFEALYDKVTLEYPFTQEKNIDWQSLYDQFAPRTAAAKDDEEFFWALKEFSLEIPDGHVGVGFNDLVSQLFFENYGGSFGMVLAELSDSRVLVVNVLPNTPAADIGLQVSAEILEWNQEPIADAIAAVEPFFGPYSTAHHKRLEQLVFLTRVAPNENVEITFKNPGENEATQAEMKAVIEYDSLFQWIPSFTEDELALPIEAHILDESGLGYIKILTFLDDYNLMAQLWDRYIRELIDWEVPGIIIDIRVNGGGSSGLARDFAGYFFDEEFILMQRSYYNHLTGKFEYQDFPSRVVPGPVYYDGPIAVLVSPYCVSACEGFAYSLTQRDEVVVVGHTPSAGAYGEVGRGQYDLPAELSMQFPTGRSETLDGDLIIEGVGVVPDILVPVTEESALGLVDAVLDAAIESLTE